MSDTDAQAALDLMRSVLNAAGVLYNGVAYDNHIYCYDVWLSLRGDPWEARKAFVRALRNAGYGICWRRYDVTPGEALCRFTLEAAGAGS